MTERSDTSSPAAGQDSPAGTHNALAGRTAADAEEASIALFAARRTELGLSHEDVANQLKFAPRLIEALEAGEFDKLPGRTFARGMLRNYAKLLKIDPAPYLAQLTAASGPQAGPEHAASLRAPIPFAEGGSHVNLVYTVLSAIILAAVAFFAYEWYQEKDAPPKMAFVAPGQEPSATQAPAQVNPPTAEPRLDTFASAGPAPVPDTEPRVEVKNPMASSAANPAMNPAVNPAVNPTTSPETKLAPPAPGKGRIVMRFDKDSWVQIKARNGTLLSQLNPAGSQRVIEGDPPFELTIGNAPSVHLTYNDQPVDLKPHFKVDVARLTLK